jgi:hypothetical protein
MTYRVYFGGGEQGLWVIQPEPDFQTVGVAESVVITAPCELRPAVPGPKPNGYLMVTGKLAIEGKTARIEPE